MNSEYLNWIENGVEQRALWRSENGSPPPQKLRVVDDTLSADAAYRLACAGTALLWRGDFNNARQLLQAMMRRAGTQKSRRSGKAPSPTPREAFEAHRQRVAQRARMLGMLLLPFSAGHIVPLRRAPDVAQACCDAYGPSTEAYVASLRELLGLIGAHEWRKKGAPIPALGASIHPHYGVFSPVRGEYVDLVAEAPLPPGDIALAFDIGVGSGVLSAVLAQRGVRRIIATDIDPRALACAADNLQRLGWQAQVELLQIDLFPPQRAALIVCNPPWLPAHPSSTVEQAIYDPDSRMLRGFLSGLAAHLTPEGEAWLILSDLAEHLGLRSRAELPAWIDAAGLQLKGRIDKRPRHPKVADPTDPLHAARAAEVTSLWRLGLQ